MLKNIDYGYSLEPPRRCGSTGTHNLYFEQKYEKYQLFLSDFFLAFWRCNFLSIYLNRRVFVMFIEILFKLSTVLMPCLLKTKIVFYYEN